MATLQQQIAEKFLAELSRSDRFDTEKLEQLKKLLAGNTKLKAEDLVKVFSLPAGGDIK